MAYQLPNPFNPRAWIDRCHLPLVVGVAASLCLSMNDRADTRIALAGGELIAVARDLSAAVRREVQWGELLCLRLSEGVAVTVDFADGRPSLVSAQLPRAETGVRGA
jgi:hypothetical protein